MLDFIEADWEVCTKQNQREEEGQKDALQQSLIWQYVSSEGQLTTRTMRRRIAKAIFAIASAESLKDYPEIWENETKEPRETSNKRQKLGNVDFETGEVADYDSDEEVADTLARVTRAIERKLEAPPLPTLPDIDNGSLSLNDAIERLGGNDAIVLRQRLLALVSANPPWSQLMLNIPS